MTLPRSADSLNVRESPECVREGGESGSIRDSESDTPNDFPLTAAKVADSPQQATVELGDLAPFGSRLDVHGLV